MVESLKKPNMNPPALGQDTVTIKNSSAGAQGHIASVSGEPLNIADCLNRNSKAGYAATYDGIMSKHEATLKGPPSLTIYGPC
jgi:hypothetical protein